MFHELFCIFEARAIRHVFTIKCGFLLHFAIHSYVTLVLYILCVVSIHLFGMFIFFFLIFNLFYFSDFQLLLLSFFFFSRAIDLVLWYSFLFIFFYFCNILKLSILHF